MALREHKTTITTGAMATESICWHPRVLVGFELDSDTPVISLMLLTREQVAHVFKRLGGYYTFSQYQ
jgi:hypothetical protein